jgi:hypothetical protein
MSLVLYWIFKKKTHMSLILVLKCFWSCYWIFQKKSNEPDTGIEMFLVLVLDLQKNKII